jgi:hypothetical protein
MRLRLAFVVLAACICGVPSPAAAAEFSSATLLGVEVFATGAEGNRSASATVIDAPVHLACPPPFRHVCLEPSPGNVAVVNIDFGTPLVDVQQVCVVFYFVGDLIEPGEAVLITFEQSRNIAGGFGNGGNFPIAQRMSCQTDPEVLAGFLDGHETGYVFVARDFTSRLGLGCGDEKHVHERRGNCPNEG